METIVTFAIPILIGLLLLKLLATPMKWFFKLVLHAACGFLCVIDLVRCLPDDLAC